MFKPCLLHLLAMGIWASHFTMCNLSLPTYKMGRIVL